MGRILINVKKEKITLNSEYGLHARPATCFVCEAKKYQCDIYVVTEANKRIDAKSIVSILAAKIGANETISILCDGTDEKEALIAMTNLIVNKINIK